MDKTTDKFCPRCGHHVYILRQAGLPPYYCAECLDHYEADEVGIPVGTLVSLAYGDADLGGRDEKI